MFDEQEHDGAVKSRIHATCLVAEPVVVILDGKETELATQNAVALRDGLAAAIARVQQSEANLRDDGTNYNVAVLAKAGAGMSLFERSKLDNGRAVLGPPEYRSKGASCPWSVSK